MSQEFTNGPGDWGSDDCWVFQLYIYIYIYNIYIYILKKYVSKNESKVVEIILSI